MIAAPALREVRLYGALGRQFGRLHRLDVRTPQEAARALCAVLPGFRRAFLGPDGRKAYHVFIGRGAKRVDVAPDATDELVGHTEPIRIVPVVEGAKRAGLFQVILGVALIALTIWNPLGLFAGKFALFAGAGTIGAAMVLSGVAQLLSPQRKGGRGQTEDEKSYGFDDGPQNSPDAGGPVPVIYGRVFAGSIVVSGGISTALRARDSDGTWLDPGVLPTPQPLPAEQPIDPEPYPPVSNTSDGL